MQFFLDFRFCKNGNAFNSNQNPGVEDEGNSSACDVSGLIAECVYHKPGVYQLGSDVRVFFAVFVEWPARAWSFLDGFVSLFEAWKESDQKFFSCMMHWNRF